MENNNIDAQKQLKNFNLSDILLFLKNELGIDPSNFIQQCDPSSLSTNTPTPTGERSRIADRTRLRSRSTKDLTSAADAIDSEDSTASSLTVESADTSIASIPTPDPTTNVEPAPSSTPDYTTTPTTSTAAPKITAPSTTPKTTPVNPNTPKTKNAKPKTTSTNANAPSPNPTFTTKNNPLNENTREKCRMPQITCGQPSGNFSKWQHSMLKNCVRSPILKVTGQNITIETSCVYDHKIISARLAEQNNEFFTHQRRSERWMKYIVTRLPACMTEEEFQEELAAAHPSRPQKYDSALFRVRQLRRTVLDENRVPHHQLRGAFFVDLPPEDKGEWLLNLRHINNLIVNVQLAAQREVPPCCVRCQRWGHTLAYCNMPRRCRRCGEMHDSRACKKPLARACRCANCGGDHPANYTGCRYCSEWQRANERRRGVAPAPPPAAGGEGLRPARHVEAGTSFASAAAPPPPRQQAPPALLQRTVQPPPPAGWPTAPATAPGAALQAAFPSATAQPPTLAAASATMLPPAPPPPAASAAELADLKKKVSDLQTSLNQVTATMQTILQSLSHMTAIIYQNN